VISLTKGEQSETNAVELIRHWEKPIKIGLCVVYVVVLSAAAGLFLLR
jgi:hypothetical protein